MERFENIIRLYNKEEKIIVYSNAKSEGPSKDLLTK
jgi:hypothetical protein